MAKFFRLDLVSEPNSPSKIVVPEIEPLLTEFVDVFSKLMGLPPMRDCDHAIHLAPNCGPVNVKPYRYPHFQKQKIERLVSEMLVDGIIQPSTSPFSSPVLLVRKKDGSWHFWLITEPSML